MLLTNGRPGQSRVIRNTVATQTTTTGTPANWDQ